MGKVIVPESTTEAYVGKRATLDGTKIVIPQRGPGSKRVYFKAKYSEYGNVNVAEPDSVLYIPDGYSWKYNKCSQYYYAENEPGEGKYTYMDLFNICCCNKLFASAVLFQLTGEDPVLLAHTFIKKYLFTVCDNSCRDSVILDDKGVHIDETSRSWQTVLYSRYTVVSRFEVMVPHLELKNGFARSMKYKLLNGKKYS